MSRRPGAPSGLRRVAAVALAVCLTAACSSEEPVTQPSADPAGTDLSTKPAVVIPAEQPPAELVVEDLVVGDGDAPNPGDLISTQYVGVAWSTREQFDASWDRGSPLQFRVGLGQVIRGWDVGIVGDEALGIEPMRVGGRRQLTIPPDLAYGDRPPPVIAPGETLVFIVDLVDVTRQG